MKILIIQSAGEHKGQDGFCRNDYLRECYAIKNALNENGLFNVDIWGLRHRNFENIPNFLSYDIIFCLEQYETDWLPDLSETKFRKTLKIQWIIDLHCQKLKKYLPISKKYDLILHSTKSLIPKYKKFLPNKKHIWFPNGVDNRFFDKKKYDYKKKNNICFVGSMVKGRTEFIKKIQKYIHMPQYFVTGEDMIKTVSEHKIHFNKSISCDVNYRNFETIGLGTCLVTNYIPEMKDLGFSHLNNCLFYDDDMDIRSIVDMIKYYLNNSNELSKIALSGYELSKQHTYTKRIKDLLKIL